MWFLSRVWRLMGLEHLLFVQAAPQKEYSVTLIEPYLWALIEKHDSSFLFDTSPLKYFHPIRSSSELQPLRRRSASENAKPMPKWRRVAWLILSSSFPKQTLAHMWQQLFQMHRLRVEIWMWPSSSAPISWRGTGSEEAGALFYLEGLVRHWCLCFHSFFPGMYISCFSFWHHNMYRLEISPSLRKFRVERLPPGLKSCCSVCDSFRAEENARQTRWF